MEGQSRHQQGRGLVGGTAHPSTMGQDRAPNIRPGGSSEGRACPTRAQGARGCLRSKEPPDSIDTAPFRRPRWIGKPGSVAGRHSSGMTVTSHLVRPTRRLGRVNPRRLRGASAYLVLLPGGFAMPVLLPVRRWALTPPFHPYLIRLRGHRRFVLCCTFRRVTPPWCYQAQHPVEPGLSSAIAGSDALIHRPTVARALALASQERGRGRTQPSRWRSSSRVQAAAWGSPPRSARTSSRNRIR